MNSTPEHEDIDFEPEDELGTLGAAKAKMQKLRDELEKVKQERQEYLDGWQRCKADAVNAKKDASTHGERLAERSKEGMLKDMLPALDSLDMAFGTSAWENLDTEWRKGMEQVKNQFLGALHKHGIERFGRVGDIYDPYLHDIVQEMDDAPGESGTIARILRYGYKFGDKIIRPAEVIIKK